MDAESILKPLKVPDETKAQAWDVFEGTSDEAEFTKRIGALTLPNETKAALWDAKFAGRSTGGAPVQSASGAATTGAAGRFIGSVGEQAIEPLLNLGKSLIQHPLDTVTQMGRTIGPQPGEDPMYGPIGRMVKGMVWDPLKKAYTQATSGDIAGGLGTITGAALPAMLSAGKPSIRYAPSGKRLTPVQQKAVQFGLREGIPVDLATRTGSSVVRGLKAVIENIPGASRIADETRVAMEARMNQLARELAHRVAPTGVSDEYFAGQSILKNLGRRINNYDDAADTAYGALREIAETKAQTVKIGSWPGGADITARIPGLTDISGLQKTAKKLLDEIEGRVLVVNGPDQYQTALSALRQASPSYAALREIVNSDRLMPIAVADRNLSTLKALARNENEHPFVRAAMRDKSQGLSARVIPEYQKAINQAAADLGPEAVRRLHAGRIATINKYELNKMLAQFNKEPARAFAQAVVGRNANLDMLKALNKKAPEVLPDIARAYLEGIIQRATDKGGIFRGQRALADWNRLGPGAKTVLYGSNAENIDSMFQLANMMKLDANPSGSAKIGGLLGLANEVASGLVLKPVGQMLGANALAKMIYSGEALRFRVPKVIGRGMLAGQISQPNELIQEK